MGGGRNYLEGTSGHLWFGSNSCSSPLSNTERLNLILRLSEASVVPGKENPQFEPLPGSPDDVSALSPGNVVAVHSGVTHIIQNTPGVSSSLWDP